MKTDRITLKSDAQSLKPHSTGELGLVLIQYVRHSNAIDITRVTIQTLVKGNFCFLLSFEID